MSEKKWIEVNKHMSIAFSFPCEGNYYYVRHLCLNIGCTKPDEKHGHIHLNCKNGYIFIPFCCYSQAGVKAVVKLLKLEENGFKGIIDLQEVKELPEELTEPERLAITSPSEIEKLAKLRGLWARLAAFTKPGGG